MEQTTSRATTILSNGAGGWAPEVRLRALGDFICGEVLRRGERYASGVMAEKVPMFFLRVLEAVVDGEPYSDTHALFLLHTRELQGLVRDFDPQVGETIAVAVKSLTAGGRPRFRYGAEKLERVGAPVTEW